MPSKVSSSCLTYENKLWTPKMISMLFLKKFEKVSATLSDDLMQSGISLPFNDKL